MSVGESSSGTEKSEPKETLEGLIRGTEGRTREVSQVVDVTTSP